MTTLRVDSTTEASPPEPEAEAARYRSLLAAARGLVRCDAAALLQLDVDVLKPVAVDGLSDETLGRQFPVAAHPRFARLLDSERGLRFAHDSNLPDPYDGLVAGQPGILPVHDCMGAPLRLRGAVWGLLTLDALEPHAFDAVGPAQMEALIALVETGIEAADTIREMQARAMREQAVAQALRAGRGAPRELLGSSPAMKQLCHEIDTVAVSDLTVLLLGETGVGKDLVAQRLHARSRRSEQPLVQVNCAALPESLADSELFGHKRGAFTGAVQDRDGKFEIADGGTLFLDEVGELPLSVQAKLLRVLQSGEVQRPGSDRMRKVDVRVIAATNRDLPAAIAQGRFRADLYHRLSVYPLVVAPAARAGARRARARRQLPRGEPAPAGRAQPAALAGVEGRHAGARLAGQCARARACDQPRLAAGVPGAAARLALDGHRTASPGAGQRRRRGKRRGSARAGPGERTRGACHRGRHAARRNRGLPAGLALGTARPPRRPRGQRRARGRHRPQQLPSDAAQAGPGAGR
ncbi:nitric oxide reductase transcriptional regulator NorR [Variovorax sp. V512]|uniref:nitric oxide reductase transcriptional regulator NorR n=1 Tax=Variovorax sp. V512 TaxID=3064160 RepID=UPI0034E8471F